MRLTNRKLFTGGLAAVAVAGLVGTTMAPANADPFRDYAAVGSDTIQDVWNGLTNDTSGALRVIASYDAFEGAGTAHYATNPGAVDVDPSTAGVQYTVGANGAGSISLSDDLIRTKTAGIWFKRPSGSGDGAIAVSRVWNPSASVAHKYPGVDTTAGREYVLDSEEIDFARSSSGASGTGSGVWDTTVGADNSAKNLAFLPFARDAVTVAVKTSGSVPTFQLTKGEIVSIYSGIDAAGDNVTLTAADGTTPVTTATNTSRVFVDPDGAGAAAQFEVFPKLPQTGSGTRSFFLTSALGFASNTTHQSTTAVAGTIAPYIGVQADFTTAQGGLPENSGTALTNTGDLIPFSVAQYIAQNNGAGGVANTTAGLKLASIFQSFGTAGYKAPITGTAPNLAPGDLYGFTAGGNYTQLPAAGDFNRDTYNVVPVTFLSTAATAPTTKQSYLANTLLRSSTGLTGTSARNIIKAYGFGTLSYANASDTSANVKYAPWK